MQIRITDHDGGIPLEPMTTDWESFKRDNADGIEPAELALIEAELSAGRSYTVAGFVGGFALIEPIAVGG